MTSVASIKVIIFSFFAVGLALTSVTTSIAQGKASKRCVVVWSEGTAPKNVYPKDINSAIAEGLACLEEWEVVIANLSDPDQGLPDALLNRADVLIWWGHKKHGEVKDELAAKIEKRVKEDGMGFISLHSAHFAKANIKLMSVCETKKEILDQVHPKNRVAAWGAYKGDSTILTIKVKDESHPIAKGIPKEFSLPHSERYSDPYAVPEAKSIVFEGVHELKDGGKDPSKQGFCWDIGKGKMFYFQPGHETNPIFFDANIRKIIANAVLWAAPCKK
ncbi:MAG: ThuA domain-containing protein [Kiritimatiellae bacterium]|nr:ThuA domain-containing protein [Kiritimatiellia bacterium]MDD5520466.1 ThuA domain-containing protein [Kiritimatiellia bacterium]